MAVSGTVRIEVHRHKEGPWLVKADRCRFAVPARVGAIIRPFSGRSVDREELTTLLANDLGEVGEAWAVRLTRPVVRREGRPIWFRVPLLSADLTIKLSKKLTPWAQTRCLVLFAISGIMFHVVGARVGFTFRGVDEPRVWILAFLLFLGSAIWHELGHAAALQREGYPPGRIGAGVLFVLPVLFADVSAMTALPRSGRLRVDVAGVCFQLGFGGILSALAPFASGVGPSLRLASLATLGAVVWSLLPFLRSDGYWLLCDLLELPDLDSAPPAWSPRWKTWLIGLFRLMNAIFMVAMVVWMPLRVHRLLTALASRAGLDPDHPLIRISALAAALFLLAGMGLAVARRIRRLAVS